MDCYIDLLFTLQQGYDIKVTLKLAGMRIRFLIKKMRRFVLTIFLYDINILTICLLCVLAWRMLINVSSNRNSAKIKF